MGRKNRRPTDLNAMNLSVDKSLDNSMAAFQQDKRERGLTSSMGTNVKLHQTINNQDYLRHGIGIDSEIVEDEAGELLESIEPNMPATG